MVTRVNPIDKHVGSRVRMRRLMLNMSQTEIGDALGLTFQQVQKYEKGANRISASRLQHLCQILQVPITFFFEDVPRALGLPEPAEAEAESPEYVNEFLSTSEGLALVRAFTRIRDPKVRRAIVALVQQVGAGHCHVEVTLQPPTLTSALSRYMVANLIFHGVKKLIYLSFFASNSRGRRLAASPAPPRTGRYWPLQPASTHERWNTSSLQPLLHRNRAEHPMTEELTCANCDSLSSFTRGRRMTTLR
jgi:transcriptional regulator with XRE-family HTH domain